MRPRESVGECGDDPTKRYWFQSSSEKSHNQCCCHSSMRLTADCSPPQTHTHTPHISGLKGGHCSGSSHSHQNMNSQLRTKACVGRLARRVILPSMTLWSLMLPAVLWLCWSPSPPPPTHTHTHTHTHFGVTEH